MTDPSGFDSAKCPHRVQSKRLTYVNGVQTVDRYCLGCGLNLDKGKTWSELDTAGQALKEWRNEDREAAYAMEAARREQMSNTEPRTFHCTSGGSSKFWTVWRSGNLQVVRFGRIGTSGQVREKLHRTVAQANQAISTLVRQKLSKGYYEIGLDEAYYTGTGSVVRPTPSAPKPKPKPKSKPKKPAQPDGFVRPRRVPKVDL